jgi:hypothetical protein
MSKPHYLFFAALSAVTFAVQGETSQAATILVGNNPNVFTGGLTGHPNAQTDWQFFIGAGGPLTGNLFVDGVNNRVGPDGGDWKITTSDGSQASPAHDLGWWTNWIAPPNGPGVYDVDVSGWAKAYAGWYSGEDFGWIQESHVELWIDSTMIWSGMSSNNTNRDQWAQHSHSGQYTIGTQGIAVVLRSIKGNSAFGTGPYGAIYADSRFDDVHLSVSYIPEPSTMALVMGGALACSVGVVRRRRRA